VDDRGAGEPLVALPVRRLGEREVDLHLAASVPETPRLAGRAVAGEQVAVQLLRGDVGEDGPRRLDRLAVGDPHGSRPPTRDDDSIDPAFLLAGSAGVADDADERIDEPDPSPARDGHSPDLDRDSDHLGHEARGRIVGPEPGVEHPRREQSVRSFVLERLRRPVAAARQDVSGELDQAAAAQPAQRLRAEPYPGARPQLGREHTEGEVGVRHEPLDGLRPASAELGDVLLVRGGEERRAAVREQRRSRQVGVQVLDAARLEVVPQLRVRGRAGEERMPGGEDVVNEARLSDLGGSNRAAEPVVPLQHADAPARLREQRGRDERVDPAPDRDRVEASVHRPPPPWPVRP
jgi:hypothetical protein